MGKQAPDIAEEFECAVSEARSLCEEDRDFRGAATLFERIAAKLRAAADDQDQMDRSPE